MPPGDRHQGQGSLDDGALRADASLRTDAERDALSAATHFARTNDLGSPPARAYVAALPRARRDVRNRLVGGLLRGEPPGLPEPTLAAPGAALRAALPVAEPPDVTTGVHDRVAVLPLEGTGQTLVAPLAAVRGFEKFDLGDPVSLVDADGADEVTHPVDLVAPLERAGAFADAEQADVIRAELAESVANLALALLAEDALADSGPDRPLDASADALPAADRPAYLERLVTRGHPFHPAGKIRRGMDAADGFAYAPEFAPTVGLRFAAVREDVARRRHVGDRSLTDRLFAALGGLADAVAEAVPGDPTEYAVVPVHPWQYHRVLPDRYDDRIADGRVVPVPDYVREATPLLNLRTVVPASEGSSDEPLPHCKLPIGVQTTNVERTLSPQAVHNGPRVSRLWREIRERESFDRLGLLEERATASYYPEGGPHVEGEGYHDARHLAGLLRQNPRSHPLVSEEAQAIPAASLVANVPGRDRPLVADLLDRYPGSHGEAAEAFVAAYADAVVPPQLRLLTAYGVALESHLQNCYVAVEGWRPAGVMVRDFGGIRVDGDRLSDRDIEFEAYPDSDLDADGATDLHRKLYYALFQNHLSELVGTLARATPVDEATCWDRIASVAREAFDRLRAESGVPDARVDADEDALFGDPIPFKALTAMRLQGKRHEYAISRVSNPLVSAPDRVTWE